MNITFHLSHCFCKLTFDMVVDENLHLRNKWYIPYNSPCIGYNNRENTSLWNTNISSRELKSAFFSSSSLGGTYFNIIAWWEYNSKYHLDEKPRSLSAPLQDISEPMSSKCLSVDIREQKLRALNTKKKHLFAAAPTASPLEWQSTRR